MLVTLNLFCTELFLVRPADGDDYVYSPIEVNVTLQCIVNNTHLEWYIDMLTFASEIQRSKLESRKIFQFAPVTSADGLTMSTVIAFGSLTLNNHSRVCCQTLILTVVKEVCTTLIVYGELLNLICQTMSIMSVEIERPSPPQNVSFQYTEESSLINISWTSSNLMGVEQNYTLNFDTHLIRTLESHYIYQQNTRDSSVTCSLFIIAVNGAGESDPSDKMFIPSLPDIGPIINSLKLQVWKSDGKVMISVSFEVRMV